MNASGSSISEIMLWLTLIIGSLILITWYVNNFFLGTSPLQKMEEDLRNLSAYVNEACLSHLYYAPHNLFTEKGELSVASGQICICVKCGLKEELKKCRQTLCEEKLEDSVEPIKIEMHTQVIVEGDSTDVIIHEP